MFQQELSQDLTSFNPQNLLVYQYAFAVVTGVHIGRIFHRFTPCDCEYCCVGSFNLCLNANFLGAWSDRILAVTENIQPTVKEELEAEIDTLLDIYRRSQLSPSFVL